MNTIIATSSVDGVDQRHRYHYKLLEQIFRDACSDEMAWEVIPREGSGDPFYRSLKNRETGDTITCLSSDDDIHTFTFIGA